MLLSGLKKYPVNISAIVSMADDGGSAGVLRDELGVLPPGDVRQCLVALCDSSEMMRSLMNYRFENGGLCGHSFGNLFLSALEKMNKSFSKGVEEAIKILNIKGEVIPVSEGNMRLHIKINNGKVIVGENNLDHNEEIRKFGIKEIFLKPKAKACKKAIDRIKKADFIIIGPGDLYGSILPNFMVEGIGEAVEKSKSKIILNCNLTNKKGQNEGFDLDKYVKILNDHIGKKKIDFVVFNKEKMPDKLVKKYEKKEGAGSVVILNKNKKDRDYRIVLANILDNKKIKEIKKDVIADSRSFIRHDGEKLAKALMKIIK